MAGATIDEDVTAVALTQQMMDEGVEALEEDNFVEAADLLSQCLEATVAVSGEQSVEAALVCIKYGTALLGCAREKGTTGLGNMSGSKVRFPTLKGRTR